MILKVANITIFTTDNNLLQHDSSIALSNAVPTEVTFTTTKTNDNNNINNTVSSSSNTIMYIFQEGYLITRLLVVSVLFKNKKYFLSLWNRFYNLKKTFITIHCEKLYSKCTQYHNNSNDNDNKTSDIIISSFSVYQ